MKAYLLKAKMGITGDECLFSDFSEACRLIEEEQDSRKTDELTIYILLFASLPIRQDALQAMELALSKLPSNCAVVLTSSYNLFEPHQNQWLRSLVAELPRTVGQAMPGYYGEAPQSVRHAISQLLGVREQER